MTNLSALRVSLSPPSIKALASTMATAMPFVELQLLSTTKTPVEGAGVSGLGFGGGWLFTMLLHIGAGAGAGAVGVVLSSMVKL